MDRDTVAFLKDMSTVDDFLKFIAKRSKWITTLSLNCPIDSYKAQEEKKKIKLQYKFYKMCSVSTGETLYNFKSIWWRFGPMVGL